MLLMLLICKPPHIQTFSGHQNTDKDQQNQKTTVFFAIAE